MTDDRTDKIRFEEQQGYRLGAVPLACDRAQGEQEALHLVRDLLRELLAVEPRGRDLVSHRLISFPRTRARG